MGMLKYYNEITGEWEPISTGEASGVISTNSALLQEEETYTTVEDALVRDREDIEHMKKNISWLALHGGGGSGGGGSDATIGVKIVNNTGAEVSNIPWKNNSEYIYFLISSTKPNRTTFHVEVRLDNNLLAKLDGYKASDIPYQVRIPNIQAYSTNLTHSLRISILETTSGDFESAEATITEADIQLKAVSDPTLINIVDFNTSEIQVSYQTGIVGSYTLYYSKNANLKNDYSLAINYIDIEITNPREAFCNIQCTEFAQSVGTGDVYSLYFVLVNQNDPELVSDQLETAMMIVSSDQVAISVQSLSYDYINPTITSKNSIFYTNFIAYLDGGNIYKYGIEAQKVQVTESGVVPIGESYTMKEMSNTSYGTYGIPLTEKFNNFNILEYFTVNSIYEITINVADFFDTSKYNSKNIYILVTDSGGQLLPLDEKENTIFDLKTYGSNPQATDSYWGYENTNYRLGSSNITLITECTLNGIGGQSGAKDNFYRFSNDAYAIINRATNNGTPIDWFPREVTSQGLVSNVNPEFTLSISYYNDYTSDDDRVIYSLGNYRQNSSGQWLGQGILIRNHDYFIKIGNSDLISGKLLDENFHQFDIVYGEIYSTQGTVKSVYIKVYENGTLLRAKNNIPQTSIFSLGQYTSMYLASSGASGSVTSKTNVSFVNVAMYNKALNAKQIVYNYINNLAIYHLNNGTPDTSIIEDKMSKNLIVKNPNTGEYSCALWDENHEGFNDSSWIIDENNQLQPKSELLRACKLPIMILDLSNDNNWTWNNFTTSNIALNSNVNVPIYYYDETGTNRLTQGTTVSVSLQGTTTKGYAIKNLDIDFGEDKLFWVKPDWFPEQVYTLKADVVDSAHANNACIGKFINDCSAEGILNPNPAMTKFQAEKNIYNLPDDNTLTVKHTLEGFPILLLAKFFTGSTNDYRSLGIYSFNLGRSSYYNLGFKLLTQFRDINGEITTSVTAPALLGKPQSVDEIFMDAESWEGIDSYNCTAITDDYPANNEAERSFPFHFDGYFWSNLPGHIRHFWEQKYPGNGNITKFQELCDWLMYYGTFTKGTTSLGTVEVGKPYDWGVPPGESAERLYYRMDMPNYSINRDPSGQGGQDYFDHKNARFYYLGCMLAGLVDNLGKNLNMRIWKQSDDSSKWFTSFYDMDCAFGLDNFGAETISPNVFDEKIYNSETGSLAMEIMDSDYASNHSDRIYTVMNNKLWGIIDDPLYKDQYDEYHQTDSVNVSALAVMWNNIRQKVLQSVDSFMNNYFSSQIGDCGELLYNQDFNVKYLTTQQIEMLHGNRNSFVKSWLRKRVKFLDSVFGYKFRNKVNNGYLTDITNIKDSSYNKKVHITHDSGIQKVPITTTCPMIITTNVGGNNTNTYYYYVEANTPTNVIMSNSGNAPNIQTWINNADTIYSIGNLKNLGIRSIIADDLSVISGDFDNSQYGSFCNLTELDLSGNTHFSDTGAINFENAFRQWNTLPEEPIKPAQLRKLDLSNTINSKTTEFAVNLRMDSGTDLFQNQFSNLTYLDVSNSAATQIKLPSSVSLTTLKVHHSKIQELELYNQAILNNVDLTGCVNLSTFKLENCSEFINVTFNGLQSLTQINLINCEKLTSLSINHSYNDSGTHYIETVLNTTVANCPTLKSVSLSNIKSSGSIVDLTGAPNLESLSVSECIFSTIRLNPECRNTLKSISINNCANFTNIEWYGENNDAGYLNLVGCPLINNISIQRNTGLQYIQVNNIENEPILLTNISLWQSGIRRIYGNFVVTGGSFSQAPSFSVHGSMNTLRYNGQAVTGKTKSSYNMIYHPYDLGDTTSIGFQSGPTATNLCIKKTSLNGMFEQTACTLFDIYYILYNDGGVSRTDLTNTFRSCGSIGSGYALDDRLFIKCGDVTSVAGMLSNCGSNTLHLVFQATVNPLVSCINFNDFLWGTSFMDCNVNVFNGGTNFVIKYFNNFAPHHFNGGTWTDIDKNFFNHLQQVETVDGFLQNTTFNVVYGISKLTTSHPLLPPKVVSVDRFFNVYNMAWDRPQNLDLHTIFPDPSKIISITRSFCFGGKVDGTKFKLDANTFSGFTNLKVLGNTNGDGFYNGSDNTTGNFNGTGLYKYIDVTSTTIPDIFAPLVSLEQCNGFFNNVRAVVHTGEENKVYTWPNHPLSTCPNLSNFNYGFYKLKIPYQLSSEMFYGTKVSTVAHCFEDSNVSGYIPAKLFKNGTVSASKTITGTLDTSSSITIPSSLPGSTITTTNNGLKIVTEVITTEEENTITEQWTELWTNFEYSNGQTSMICTPMTKIAINYMKIVNDSIENTSLIEFWYGDITNESSGEYKTSGGVLTISNPVVSDTISYNYIKWTPWITNMDYCFNKCWNLVPYENTNPDSTERNQDYCPFEYIKSGGTWVKAKRNDGIYTYMWEYDGIHKPIIYSHSQEGDTYEFLDEIDYELDTENETLITQIRPCKIRWDGTSGQIPAPISVTGSFNFSVPPDILRACTQNVSLQSFLGVMGMDINPLTTSNTDIYHLIGRLCPYLLRPIPEILSLANMFNGFQAFTPYQKTDWEKSSQIDDEVTIPCCRVIPKTFFDYTPNVQNLSYMFSELYFPENVDINDTFKSLTQRLNINGIFYDCFFEGSVEEETINYCEISNIFKNNLISQLNKAFMYYSHLVRNTAWRADPSIARFQSCFDLNNITYGADTEVFWYRVNSEFSYELRTDAKYNNYPPEEE